MTTSVATVIMLGVFLLAVFTVYYNTQMHSEQSWDKLRSAMFSSYLEGDNK